LLENHEVQGELRGKTSTVTKLEIKDMFVTELSLSTVPDFLTIEVSREGTNQFEAYSEFSGRFGDLTGTYFIKVNNPTDQTVYFQLKPQAKHKEITQPDGPLTTRGQIIDEVTTDEPYRLYDLELTSSEEVNS
jgi:hypothetical protein